MSEDLNVVVLFFFFKQKTAYEIGTGDWSSDVCSSDLKLAHTCLLCANSNIVQLSEELSTFPSVFGRTTPQIGRASCRERV